MISVEFKSVGPGKCRWCKKDRDEVIELSFGDGSFVGRYCFGDFKKALLDKLENEASTKKPSPPAVTLPVQPASPAPPNGAPVAK